MSRTGLLAFVGALVLGAAVWVVPWALEDRAGFAAVPSPRALEAIADVPVPAGERACAPDVGLDEKAVQIALEARAQPTPRPALHIEVVGAGYRSRTVLPASAPEDTVILGSITPPRRDRLVRVCVVNRGRTPLVLAASADRTQSRSDAIVDGRPVAASPWIAFGEAAPRSMLRRSADVLSRMATFRPGLVGPVVLGLLALLVVVGVPVAVAWAWSRSLRD